MEKLNLCPELESELQRKADRESVRYAVMRTIFCPKCGDIMDMRRAVQTTAYAPSGKIAAVVTVCAPCHDNGVRAALEEAQSRVPGSRLETADGRILWKR